MSRCRREQENHKPHHGANHHREQPSTIGVGGIGRDLAQRPGEGHQDDPGHAEEHEAVSEYQREGHGLQGERHAGRAHYGRRHLMVVVSFSGARLSFRVVSLVARGHRRVRFHCAQARGCRKAQPQEQGDHQEGHADAAVERQRVDPIGRHDPLREPAAEPEGPDGDGIAEGQLRREKRQPDRGHQDADDAQREHHWTRDATSQAQDSHHGAADNGCQCDESNIERE